MCEQIMSYLLDGNLDALNGDKQSLNLTRLS